MTTALNILEVQASARGTGSISRELKDDLVSALKDPQGEVTKTPP